MLYPTIFYLFSMCIFPFWALPIGWSSGAAVEAELTSPSTFRQSKDAPWLFLYTLKYLIWANTSTGNYSPFSTPWKVLEWCFYVLALSIQSRLDWIESLCRLIIRQKVVERSVKKNDESHNCCHAHLQPCFGSALQLATPGHRDWGLHEPLHRSYGGIPVACAKLRVRAHLYRAEVLGQSWHSWENKTCRAPACGKDGSCSVPQQAATYCNTLWSRVVFLEISQVHVHGMSSRPARGKEEWLQWVIALKWQKCL